MQNYKCFFVNEPTELRLEKQFLFIENQLDVLEGISTDPRTGSRPQCSVDVLADQSYFLLQSLDAVEDRVVVAEERTLVRVTHHLLDAGQQLAYPGPHSTGLFHRIWSDTEITFGG